MTGRTPTERANEADVPRPALERYVRRSMGSYISPGLSEMEASSLALGQFLLIAARFQIACVHTVEEIRHSNLLRILDEFAARPGSDGRALGERGAIQRLATAVGKSHSQISQLATRQKHSKTGQPRNIGPKVARELEIAADKPRGWLDQTQGADPESMDAKLQRLVDLAVEKRLGGADAPKGKDPKVA